MRLTYDQLRKRKVMTSDGKEIGDVVGLEIDTESLRVTAVQVKVHKEMVKEIGAKKPLIGRAELKLAISKISGIGDAVILRATAQEMLEESETRK